MRILILLFLGTNLFAINADSLFMEGNSFFESEKYRKAAQNYEQLLTTVEHADLYYNLGNTYYRMGEIGYAVWAYEKGLQFEPRNQDIRHNLDISNTHVKDRIELPDWIVLLKWYEAFKNAFTVNDFFLMGSFFLLLVGFVYFLSQFNFLGRRTLNRLYITFLSFTIFAHGISLDKYWDLSEIKDGVIISQMVNVYSIPAVRDEMIVFIIHEGLKVEITQSQNNWVEIRLLDGKKGWITEKNLRQL